MLFCAQKQFPDVSIQISPTDLEFLNAAKREVIISFEMESQIGGEDFADFSLHRLILH